MVDAQQYLDQNYPNTTRGNITELDLSNKNLTGSLNFYYFTNAWKLNFSFNELTALGWERDAPMEVLDISYNKLGSSIWGGSYSLKFVNFSHNSYYSIWLNIPTLSHLNVSNNDLIELKFENTTDLQTLDCSNNWNLVTDRLSLPNHFNPIYLDCQNTSLGQIRFFNSSVFDCQKNAILSQSYIPSSNRNLIMAIAIPSGVLLLIAVATIIYYRYQWKRASEQQDNRESHMSEIVDNQQYQAQVQVNPQQRI